MCPTFERAPITRDATPPQTVSAILSEQDEAWLDAKTYLTMKS